VIVKKNFTTEALRTALLEILQKQTVLLGLSGGDAGPEGRITVVAKSEKSGGKNSLGGKEGIGRGKYEASHALSSGGRVNPVKCHGNTMTHQRESGGSVNFQEKNHRVDRGGQ